MTQIEERVSIDARFQDWLVRHGIKELSQRDSMELKEIISSQRDSILDEVEGKIEELRVIDNVEIPYCKDCNRLGLKEKHCAECGKGMGVRKSTGVAEIIKNSIIDDALSTIKEMRKE